MTFNNTFSTPSQCASHALILSTMTRPAAITLWLNLLCIALPYTLIASIFCATHTTEAASKAAAAAASSATRRFFGTTEKWFCASTVFLGIHVLVFLAMALAIQAQRYCTGGPISDGSYAFQWIMQGLLVGGALASACLCWWNSLLAVKRGGSWGEESRWRCEWWVVFKWEAYVIASPFILLAMGVVVLVRGPEAWRELRFVKAWREWRAARRSDDGGCRAMGGSAGRRWWGGRRHERFYEASETPTVCETSPEKRHWPGSPLKRKDVPPPHASDWPLSWREVES